MQEIQNRVTGLECDTVGDFNFILGDLNYRLETFYSQLNNSNVVTDAIRLIPTHDQLITATNEGYYPGYVEQEIKFLPTYKMSTKEQFYVNKKD